MSGKCCQNIEPSDRDQRRDHPIPVTERHVKTNQVHFSTFVCRQLQISNEISKLYFSRGLIERYFNYRNSSCRL
jgi:hypothetical protein